MIDPDLLYGPIYAILSTSAVLTTQTGVSVTLDVIDKTTGLVTESQPGMVTIKPAAKVRMSDLTAASLTRRDLLKATLTLDGATWRVLHSEPVPGPAGESRGELCLYLSEVSRG